MSLEIGMVLEGEVAGIAKFGAFVQLPEGKVGLVHVSEVANAFVKDIHDFLKEHDKVQVKVISIDEKGKIALSIKRALPDVPTERKPVRNQQERKNEYASDHVPGKARFVPPATFEDKLSRFLKDSDDRMLDLRRNTESKRGGRGARRDK